MKKFILAVAMIIVATSAQAGNATTDKVLKLAPSFDKRIQMAYISNGNTVVLQGKWPVAGYFDAKNVANGWCIEFKTDPTITNIIIANMQPKILGNARCKK
jgi:hypothetical protein